jgi:hypothetical protein
VEIEWFFRQLALRSVNLQLSHKTGVLRSDVKFLFSVEGKSVLSRTVLDELSYYHPESNNSLKFCKK